MKFKLKNLKKALDAFRYAMPEEAVIEFISKEEDLEKSTICSSLTMSATWTEPAAKYDDNQEPVNVSTTLELFSDEENRPFRIVTNKTREYKVT